MTIVSATQYFKKIKKEAKKKQRKNKQIYITHYFATCHSK